MKWVAISIGYICFFSVIGFAVYWTKSGLPLFAIMLVHWMLPDNEKGGR